jgi:hypothetical protein
MWPANDVLSEAGDSLPAVVNQFVRADWEATMALSVVTAAHLVSIVGLGVVLNLGTDICLSAAEGTSAEVAYVESVTGSVIAFAQGRPRLVEALDTIGDRTQLDLKANSELRICHYRSGKLVTLQGPLRIVVSAAGIENPSAMVNARETCSKPAASIFHGGTTFRGIRGGGPAQ